MLKVKLWGVRGSIPCPGSDTVHFGGNTACIEVRPEGSDNIYIIDAGSGLRSLGDSIMKNDFPKTKSLNINIFLSHTHWDHIMGLPFFTPIYLPTTKMQVFGPVTYEEDTLDVIVGGQLRYRYFPVKHSELSAEIKYKDMKETTMEFDDGLKVTTKYLNHPILCLGYRFEYKGKIFCTAYDTEPFRNLFPTDPEDPSYDEFAAEEGEAAAKEENEKLVDFFKGADLLIHDSQYTNKEYLESKIGWGHSTYEYSIKTAHKAGVKKLLLFHHDPLRTDKELFKLEKQYKKAASGKTTLEFEMAVERKEFII